jgi:hypothetical protein
MVLRVAALALLLAAVPVHAASRGTLIAMAVALLDVAEEHCTAETAIDDKVKVHLLADFHQYDIGGLASVISAPLNSFYEEFLQQVKHDRRSFCREAPAHAASTGYPVIVAE